MKIGPMTESLGGMPIEAVLATCAEMGIEAVEFGTGYDDVLSIEHEDFLTGRVEGVREAVELPQSVIPSEPASYQSPDLG